MAWGGRQSGPKAQVTEEEQFPSLGAAPKPRARPQKPDTISMSKLSMSEGAGGPVTSSSGQPAWGSQKAANGTSGISGPGQAGQRRQASSEAQQNGDTVEGAQEIKGPGTPEHEGGTEIVDDRHVSVRDDSESMLIIKAKEWNEENIRYGCTLLEKGTSLKLAAREAGCMLQDLRDYYDGTWHKESDGDSDGY